MPYSELPAEWKSVLSVANCILAENLSARAENERQYGLTIYPAREDTFRAYHMTKPNDLKAVILGQDPYHGAGQAHGLSFSVQSGVKLPPSLQNIFKELYDDLGISAPVDGDLSRWAMQGIMMLNTALTVESGSPSSHSNWGWSNLVAETLQYCNMMAQTRPIVFILWGRHAQNAAKDAGIDLNAPNVIKSAHPSPFSASGFFGTKPFSRTNKILNTQIGW